MICLRCGFCCVRYAVIIVAPGKFDPDMTVAEIEAKYGPEAFVAKDSDTPCPHLRAEQEKASCAVRECKFYDETPCFQFCQIESTLASECRIGRAVLDGRIKFKLEAPNG